MRSQRPSADLVELVESDIGELARFIASQSGRASTIVESHLRWFLLENPARESSIPLGCGLRSSEGELVGCILYVPQLFRYQQQTLLGVWSSCFYVDERYRGGGLALFFKFADLGAHWPLFANSANAAAAKFWQVRRGTPIPDTDHELFGVVRWSGVIEEALTRHGAPKPLARSTGPLGAIAVAPFHRLKLKLGRAEDLTSILSAAEASQLPLLKATPEFTANRDQRYLHWRYFSGHDATVGVFAFRNRETNSDVLVTVNQRIRGYRQQIRTLNVLDIYPAVGPEICAVIIGALLDRYHETIDAVVLRGLDGERQRLFQSMGFQRREFDAPTAWVLDSTGQLPAKRYFVPADGDAII